MFEQGLPEFRVGVFECIEAARFPVCKVTFGVEPKDYEVWGFILKYYDQLKLRKLKIG